MIFGEYYDLDQDKIDNAADRYADMMAEESIMGVDEITNMQTHSLEDGSMTLTMDISSKNQFRLIDRGMQYIVDAMIINDQLLVDETNEFNESTRTITLTNEMANVLFHFGCISGLKKGIEEHKANDES